MKSDETYPIKENSLLFYLLKLFELNNFNFIDSIEYIFARILTIIYENYKVKLVVIIDQINEIKEIKDSNQMVVIYNIMLKYSLRQLSLIQCASNNNMFTRDIYKEYLCNPDSLSRFELYNIFFKI